MSVINWKGSKENWGMIDPKHHVNGDVRRFWIFPLGDYATGTGGLTLEEVREIAAEIEADIARA